MIALSVSSAIFNNISIENNYAGSDAGGLMLQNITYLQINNINCTLNSALAGNGGCLSILDSSSI